MKHILTYLQPTRKMLALLWLILFPLHTVLIYSESFVNGYKWEYGTLAYYGIELLGWMFVASCTLPLLRRAQQSTFRLSVDRKLLLSILAFLVYGFVAALWAVNSNLAQQQTTVLILMSLMMLLLPTVLSRREIVASLALGTVLPLGIGLYQFFAQDLFASRLLGMSGPEVADGGVSVIQFGQERWLRAYGTFAHPNVFGGYLALVIISVLVRLQEHTKQWVQAAYMGLLLCIGTMLIYTMSRSAWIAVVLGIGAMLLLVLRHLDQSSRVRVQKGMIALGIGIIFGVSIAWPLVSSRVFGGSAHEYASVHERMALQDIAIELFAQHPIVGVGPGNMTAALIEYDGTKAGYAYQPVHSVPLLILVEYGILGVVLVLITMFYFVRFIMLDPAYVARFVSLVALLPLLLFDHYLLTSVHGLGIGAVYLAILLSPNASSSAVSSPQPIDA